ncbi:MAG: hypothetical protein ACR2GY_11410 [Phycisphaerales bacterium]
MRYTRNLLAACATLAMATAAHAQFTDDFESYTLGGGITGSSNWEEWCGSSGVDANVTNAQARSGTQSILMEPGDDVVHQTNKTSGKWEISWWTYIPTGATGETYFIILNSYFDDTNCIAAQANWSAQVRIDADDNVVNAEFVDEDVAPLIRDQWVQVRAIIDLDNDVHDIYYGGCRIAAGRSWSEGTSGGGAVSIEAVDMYNQDCTEVYYDDFVFAASTTGVAATLVDAVFDDGMLIDGDLESLECVDLVALRGTSQFGFLSSRPNVQELITTLTSPSATPSTLDVRTRVRFNNPGATVEIRLRNQNTGRFVEVGELAGGGANQYATLEVLGVPAANYVDGTDQTIELSINSFIIATFQASGYIGSYDLVEVIANN